MRSELRQMDAAWQRAKFPLQSLDPWKNLVICDPHGTMKGESHQADPSTGTILHHLDRPSHCRLTFRRSTSRAYFAVVG